MPCWMTVVTCSTLTSSKKTPAEALVPAPKLNEEMTRNVLSDVALKLRYCLPNPGALGASTSTD